MISGAFDDLINDVNTFYIGLPAQLERASKVFHSKPLETGYPPYNIVDQSEDKFAVILAVAGFHRDELHVIISGKVLTVKGEINPEDPDPSKYRYRGIATRRFAREFRLADNVHVDDVRLEDGLLTINCSLVGVEGDRMELDIQTGKLSGGKRRMLNE